MRPLRALPALTLTALLAGGGWSSSATAIEADIVVLQGLDKITARISTFEVGVDKTEAFGTLAVTARHCEKTPPEEPPERKVFLEIVDERPDGAVVDVFTGWMFSSSPALSAMEHPVYDVWVVDCRVTEDEAGTEEDSEGDDPEG